MRFDHDFNLFWKLTSVLILYANITWRKSLIYVLLFPIFQRSCGVLRHPVFWTECKGKGLFYFNQFFSEFYEVFLPRTDQKEFEELFTFFEADGKDTRLTTHHQFFHRFLFTSPSHSSHPKRTTRFFQSGPQRYTGMGFFQIFFEPKSMSKRWIRRECWVWGLKKV